jgi:signal transduction histidine kinase
VAQEAVRNAVRHGRPTELSVVLEREAPGVRLTVVDNGTGFEPQDDPIDGAHIGLRSMRDLAREAGGVLHVESTPGQGTRVRLEVGT